MNKEERQIDNDESSIYILSNDAFSAIGTHLLPSSSLYTSLKNACAIQYDRCTQRIHTDIFQENSDAVASYDVLNEMAHALQSIQNLRTTCKYLYANAYLKKRGQELRLLIYAYIDLLFSHQKYELLQKTVFAENALLVAMLAKAGVDIDARSHGATLLHGVVLYDAGLKSMAILLANGADRNAIQYCLPRRLDFMHHTALHRAAARGRTDMVRLLLKHGACVNPIPSDKSEWLHHPLHCAVKARQTDMVRLLLDYGADINSTDFCGNTSLHRAAETCNMDLVKLLVERGADVCRRNNAGQKPVDIAARYYFPSSAPEFGAIWWFLYTKMPWQERMKSLNSMKSILQHLF